MDSDSENEIPCGRRWRPSRISNSGARNVALKSFEPPNYETLKEEYEDKNCFNCKTYKEKVGNLQRRLDDVLHQKDTHELCNKALKSELEILKDSDTLSRQEVKAANRKLSHTNEDLQRQTMIVSHQKVELQKAREEVKEKEKLVKEKEKELQTEHKVLCQLQAQLIKMEGQGHGEWQENQRKLEEEKEKLMTTNTALQADIVDLLKQRKHDKEVIDTLLDQLDERNEEANASPPVKHTRSILVLGDTNAYEIGQNLEKTHSLSVQFDAFHHTRQLVDYAESCPPALDKSDQILIHVGMTDITGGLTATQIRSNIEKAVRVISDHSKTPIFITTIPPIKTHVKHDIEVRRLNRYLAEIENVTILNVYEDTEPSLAGDGYQLTSSSTEHVAATLADKMQAVVTTEHTEPNASHAADTPPRTETKWERRVVIADEPDKNQHQSTSKSGQSGRFPQRNESPQFPPVNKAVRQRSLERSESSQERELSPEKSEHDEPKAACYDVKTEEPRRETRLLIRVRQEDMAHVIGKCHQNMNRLTEKYHVDIHCNGDGKVLIIGKTQNAEETARDIEKTIDRLYKFRDGGFMRNPIPRFN